jgi:hypothetical protein
MVSFGNVKLLLKDGTDALDIKNRSNLNASGTWREVSDAYFDVRHNVRQRSARRRLELAEHSIHKGGG